MAKRENKTALANTQWPDPTDGPGWGVMIQRYHEPRDWPRELEKVPDEFRAAAEEYLRGIAARIRVVRRLRGGE